MLPILKKITLASLLFGLFLTAGCVSKKMEPAHQPKLGVAHGSDGVVTLALDTRSGYKYQILYQSPDTQRWTPLPGCGSIQGTGGTIEIKKRFNSRKALPAFTVGYSKIQLR